MSDHLDPGSAQTHQSATSSSSAGPFSTSDLPIDDEGRIYHLQVKPAQIAPDIILVGDPGRCEFIGSTFLRDIEFEHEHRGLVTTTGISALTSEPATVISPVRATVATSGMGTPSLEIVVNELVALHEIDLRTRTRKSEFPRLHVLRVGTSGALQVSTALGTPIITSYAIGMDNTGLYYEVPYADAVSRRLEGEVARVVEDAMKPTSRFRGQIRPYVARAAPGMVDALRQAANSLGVPAKVGLTVSSSGFFAPQGRDISRLSPSAPDLDKVFADYDPGLGGQRVENMEMETSFLIHFLGGLGHWAGAICPTIAHRRQETFDHNYRESIEAAVEVALLALATLRQRYPDAVLGRASP